MNNRGFTLIEILMVVMLIGVVAVVAVPQYIDFTNNAKIAVTQEKLVTIKQAIIGDPRIVSEGRVVAAGFIAHMGSVPANLTVLVTQGAQANYDPFTKTGWRGPYLDDSDANWDRDAWGTALSYDSVGRTITSYGPDGVSGGGDDISVSF